MKSIKINYEILSILLVILLIATSFNSFGLCTEVNYINNNIEKNYSSSDSSIRIKSQVKLVSNSIITKEQGTIQNLNASGFDDRGNIGIADTSANESYPSMVIKDMNGLVAYEYNQGTKPFIYLKNTKDLGKNWSDSYILNIKYNNIYPSLNSPSLSINPGTGYAYGAFLSDYNNSGICGVIELSDISGGISIIKSMITDWSNIDVYSFWGFKDINIKYHSFNDNVPWIVSYIGSTNYYDPETDSGPCKNAIMFNYLDSTNPAQDQVWIQWEPGYGNCSNLSVAISDDYKKIYGVSEIINGSNIDLLYFSGSYNSGLKGPSIDLNYYSFTGPEDLYHPNIYVKGNNIYIAAENNLQEIILFKSTNSGNNWLRYNLTSEFLPPDSNPKYPNLFADKTTLYCTFIESGNILITSSPIGKINWTKPVRLNDIDGSVVSKYRFSDMFDKDNIVWTDIRNGNYDLYSYIFSEYDLKVDNVEITNLGRPFLQTKNMINFTIVNLGRTKVYNVDIKVICGRKDNSSFETEYPGFLASLNSYAEKPFNQYLFRMTIKEFIRALISFINIKTITVIVDPDKKYDDKNLNDNSFTIQVSQEDIFPFISSF